MAVTVTNLSNPLATKLVVDTDANATSEDDVTGASGNIFLVEIDNTNNPNAVSYVKLYNAASATVGATAPDLVFPAPGGTKLTYCVPQGVAFGTRISVACTTAGGTAGTASPGATVTVRILTS